MNGKRDEYGHPDRGRSSRENMDADPLATHRYTEPMVLRRKESWNDDSRCGRMAYIQEGKEKWEQTEHGKLCLAFYEAFQAYRKYLEENAVWKTGLPQAGPWTMTNTSCLKKACGWWKT